MPRAARWALGAYAAVVLALALASVRPTGDCGEYILMARGFVSHQSPDFRAADASWLARREPRLAGVASHLKRGLAKQREGVIGTVRAPSGRYYSMHFWFYSLLAAPVLAVLELAQAPPLIALTSVNAAAALLAMAYALWSFRGSWLAFVAPGAFLLAGTTYYLRFTGAELLTASGAFIAALAASRGELGIGFLAAGVAATQNPSAAALFPFVLFQVWRRRRAIQAPGTLLRSRFGRREFELGAAGLLLAGLPYLFFQLEYDVPSLIGKYAVDTGLIGLERLKSFLFDLNQGLAPNLPGVILGVVVLLVLQKPTLDLALRSFAVLCAVLAMATPTLAAPNWNSGSIVIMRYAYWAAMPLVALLLELAASVAWRRAALVLCLFAAGQLAVLATNGLRGEDASYLRHGWLARTVLARAPSAYEPVTEVFVERTLGREAGLREDQALAWPRHGWPKKVLVHESIKFAPAMDCPAGTEPMPSSLSRLSGGWEYQNGPFRCGVPAARP